MHLVTITHDLIGAIELPCTLHTVSDAWKPGFDQRNASSLQVGVLALPPRVSRVLEPASETDALT